MPTGIFERKPHTEETKSKIRLALIGRVFSEKHRSRLSVAAKSRQDLSKKGEGYWMGKQHIIHEEKHFNWLGENAGYVAKHNWVRKYKGKPLKCEDCGISGFYLILKNGLKRWSIQWSNINGKYRRNLEDYIARCSLCHRRYDLQINLSYEHV